MSEAVSADAVVMDEDPSKNGFVFELEACAASIGLIQMCAGYDSNEAALSALIRCRSSSAVVSSFLMTFCEYKDASGNQHWCEQITSKSNPADAPSRMTCDHLPISFRQRLDVDKGLGSYAEGLMRVPPLHGRRAGSRK